MREAYIVYSNPPRSLPVLMRGAITILAASEGYIMSMPTISPHIQNIDRDQALNSIISSIALSEAALAHILNADGEKIQLAVSMVDPDSPNAQPEYIDDQEAGFEALLDVNDSVQYMASIATNLERMLGLKLATVMDRIMPQLPEATGPTG